MKSWFGGRFLFSEFPFVDRRVLMPLLGIWIVSTAFLIVRFRTPDTDSVMYGLPLAFARGPFSLYVPMLGDFPPYSSTWGHQWPGSMWLRGTLFAWIPFERWIDASLMLVMQFAAAFLAGKLVWSLTRGVAVSVAATLIVLSDRLIIAGLALSRFEALVVLALVALLLALVKTAGKDARTSGGYRRWLAVSFLGAFVAACSHPFGMAVAAGLAGLACIDWVVFHRRYAVTALVPAAGFLLGVIALAAYYTALPEAFGQLQRNLSLQNSFNQGSRWALVLHLREYRVLGYGLWGAAALAVPWVFFKLRQRSEPAIRFCAWALPLAALAVPTLFLLTRSANYSYLTIGTPFAAILLGTGVGWIRPGVCSLAARTGLAILALGFVAIFPFRWLAFFKAGCPNFPAEIGGLIRRLPADVRVFIPPSLWDVAREDGSRDYRLYSLCIASAWETRLAYERQAYGEAKAGDIMVVDRIFGKAGDPWGYFPTFEARPPDARYWKPLFELTRRVPGAGHDYGYDFAIYEFRGVPWDPGDTPRTSISGR